MKKIKKLLNKVLRLLSLIFWVTIKTIMIGIIGMGLYFIIPIINLGLVGHYYALFASCACSGLLWSLIPDFWRKSK